MTNLNKYTEKLFRDMYWKEFDRKDKINANLSLPAGILTVLAGVEAFYMQNFPFPKWTLCTISFVVLSVALFISIAFAVYYFIRAYHLGYAYGYIPNAEEIAKYASDLKKYYESIQSTDIDEKVENDLRVFLTAEYSKYGTINTQNNDEKSKYLHHANIAISISLIFLFLSLFPFYIVYHSTSKIQKVEAVNKK
jgi:hypothetical protein